MKKTISVDKAYNDMRIDRLLRNHLGKIPQGLIEKNLRIGNIKLNKKRKGMLGWRLQIHSDTDREKAKKIRISFMLKFPEIPAYLVHKEPYFKVTVGDFYTRLEALKVQNEIRRRYTSYIVPSNINLADD